ncbi:MAG: ribosome silencing factor [Spirochaetales bacterium]|nr:ribosome silencing factor [Spirochaetales bacterium]
MDDTLKNDALNVAKMLDERGAQDTVALEMGEDCSWAQYLVICTVSSQTQMRGMATAARKEMEEVGHDVRSGSKRVVDGAWRIIDAGSIVVSIMDSECRAFYNLEERWYGSTEIFRSEA